MKHNIDSDEEMAFCWWLDELIEAGYVIDYTDAATYQLTDGLNLKYVEIKKKGNLVKEQTLLNDSIYTPDFEIKWHKSALNIFVNPPIIKLIDGVAYTNELTKFDKNLFIKSGECLVEVKPAFDKHNMTRLVNINIKQMMQRHNIFVNLVKIPDLFKKTFTPKKYLFTPTGKNKVINYKVVLLEEYLKNKQNG